MNVDKDLIAKIRQNDRKTIMAVYHETFSVLMSVAVRYKKNEEEQMSIVNDSFMKIINKIEQFKIGTSFFSWAKRIAINEGIDDYRREKKYQDLFNFERKQDSYEEATWDTNIDSSLEAEDMAKMLNQLPPGTRLVFNMYAIDGYTTKEIEEELNIKYETIKWHIKEARKKLKWILEHAELNEHL